MKAVLENRISALSSSVVALILVLVPFYAFVTVWPANTFGHYTAWRLFDDALLGLATIGAIGLVVLNKKICRQIFTSRITWLIIAYAALEFLTGAVALSRHDVSTKALWYGLLANLRFLLFFVVTWVVATSRPWLLRNWSRLLLWPAAVVVVFGILQWLVLPVNFLRHFGYGPQTIQPFETINHNQHYIRIMSTLRGANPLGAYLVVAAGALAALLVKNKRRGWLALLAVAGAIALYLSFSRSAWIGALLALVVVGLVVLPKTPKTMRITATAAVIIIAIGIIGVLGLRHNARFENVFFHSQTHSTSPVSSDQAHASALRQGLKNITHEPLGRGPGTAGPASVYNNHPARIAENYFVQIGQEVGWLGLALFLAINLLVARALWRRRRNALALAMLASLIGVTFVNFLSHAWADDTLAFLWWGMAGIAMAIPLQNNKSKKRA